jgi:outer membrane lipoprotein carrier protein
MSRRPAALVATILAMSIGVVSAAPVDEIVKNVQARFDATSDFTAVVQQELVMASAGKTVNASGTVVFKRPGRMRWTLKNGDEQTIVADGQTLWFYQPAEEQVLKAPFQAAFRSTTPISFLTGVGRISEDFEATLEASEGDRITLGLRSRKGEAELGRLRLEVDATTYDIRAAEIVDPLGNITRLRFSDLRRNTGVDDAQFRFVVPPGVDVIEAPIGN